MCDVERFGAGLRVEMWASRCDESDFEMAGKGSRKGSRVGVSIHVSSHGKRKPVDIQYHHRDGFLLYMKVFLPNHAPTFHLQRSQRRTASLRYDIHANLDYVFVHRRHYVFGSFKGRDGHDAIENAAQPPLS